ncbi:MAG: DUF4982 domain-containing protein [Prolixibacteraceae bacterium]|jgi:beta-galactosidase|nr:DUF4982 domain-containing protein [Prolixibacteraceae bacterium]
MKYNLSQLLVLLLMLSFSYKLSAQIATGSPEMINNKWKFSLSDNERYKEISFDDNKWRGLNLPHDWSVEHPLSPTLASCTGYLPGGIGWYRKQLDISSDKKGEKVYLYFEGVYNRSEVYLNGQLLGKRPNGYISFMYDATPYINFGGENVVAVRVDHSKSADSRWYTGSGIYRNVWLVYANPVHFAQWGVFAYADIENEKKAVLNIESEIENETAFKANIELVNELYDANGKLVGKATERYSLPANEIFNAKQTINVKKPNLWDLDHPYLYTLKTTLLKNGTEVDQSETQTGFRFISFSPDKGMSLNGKNIKVKGVCLHHDAGVLGAAVPKEVWASRLETLKSIGCNAIRTSHNPQATALYELCDQMGFLIMNEAFDEWEFPKRKWIEGWNVGTPGFQGAYDFFEEWSEQDVADMVRRDRNHPSIFTWSIGNEVDYPNDPYSHPILDGSAITQPMYGGYKPDAPDAMRLGDIAKSLVAAVKKHDTSRPVTAALAGVVMSNETEYPGALDIAGYNYTENRYDIDHEKYPERVIYGSENRHDMNAWKAVRDNDHIFGQFLWTGFDYLGESGRWPSRGLYTGLIDFSGTIKPRGHFRASLWKEEPTIYIGTYPIGRRKYESIYAWPRWNYRDGQEIRVACYMNTPQAKLLLNGEVAGQLQAYDDSDGIIYWDIPYETGKLTAVGVDANGEEVCSYEIESSSRPAALVASTDKKTLDKNREVSVVSVQVVDENGVPVFLSDDMVTCRINGPAKLLGLEAGSNSDMSDYTDNRHRVFHGTIVAFIETTGEAGDVEVSFSSEWLKGDEVEFTVE